MKTKILSLIIFLFVISDTFGMEVSVGDLWYDIDGNNSTAEVVYFREYVNYVNVIIPSTITHNGRVYQVTSIAENTFNSCSNLTSIEIPNTVTSIGDYAFRGCSSLSSITIPNGVTTIGSYTFGNCSALRSINIPNNIWAINHYAFHGCSSLSSLIIPNGVRFIGSGAFLGCTSLTQLIIPNGVTEIQGRTFENCTSLKSVSLPSEIKIIGETAFYNCSSLTSIEVPNSVTSIGYSAFKGCSSLTSFTIPNQMTVIEKSLFSGCTALNSIFISNSVTTIKKEAFENCISLFSIVIPENVTSIGENVFQGCSKLTSIIWKAIYYDWFGANGIFDGVKDQITSFKFGDSVQYIPSYLCSGMNKLLAISIPNSVTTIGNEAFRDCASIKSITIPEQVTEIGYSSFSECSSLCSIIWNAKSCSDFTLTNSPFYDIRNQITSFEFGDSVQHIPSNLCSGMKKLTSILIPNSVDSIETKAFSDCSSLPFISIPYKVKFIGKDVFAGCSKITSVRWNAESCPYPNNHVGSAPFYAISDQITSFEFGDSVKSISTRLCENMSKLTSIVIPSSVDSIAVNAFIGCRNISVVKIKAINPPMCSSREFYDGCRIYIPDNTLSVYQEVWGRDYIYMNNETIVSIEVEVSGTLTDCILGEGKRPFNIVMFEVIGLLNEEDFTCIKQDMTSLVEVDMSGVVNEKGVDFCNKNRLEKIILPKNLTEIKDSAFYYCSKLNSIKIPSTLAKIGVDAFYYCAELSSLELPSSIYEIGNNAFKRCNSLTSIKCLGFTPPNAEELGLNASNCTLWVPKESFKEYAKHTYWGKFLNIKTLEDGYKKVNIISINDSLGVVNSINGYYNANDLVNIIATPKEGYCFVRWSDGNTDNPRVITITEDVNLTAEFAINQYQVTLESDGNGSVSGSGVYDYGTEATIGAIANEGYHFVKWSDENIENPRTIVVTEDVVLRAEFAINEYEVVVESDGNGIVTGSGVYDYATEVTIEAIANEGYYFVQWSDGNIENPRTIVVNEDIELTAIFEKSSTPVNNLKDDNIVIYTKEGLLYVEGAETDYYVLDAAGRLVYSGRESALLLPRGVYVVNVGSEVQKVVI